MDLFIWETYPISVSQDLVRVMVKVRVKVRFMVQKYLGFDPWRHSEPFTWETYTGFIWGTYHLRGWGVGPIKMTHILNDSWANFIQFWIWLIKFLLLKDNLSWSSNWNSKLLFRFPFTNSNYRKISGMTSLVTYKSKLNNVDCCIFACWSR